MARDDDPFVALRGFDWDAGNREHIAERHGVAASECEQVFFNHPLVVAEDAAHSDTERRFFVLGETDRGRPLFVVFTRRGELLRVVTARDMSRRERRIYRDAD